MKILCLDDEPLALKMLQISVEKVKPDAAVKAFTKQKNCDIIVDVCECADPTYLQTTIHRHGIRVIVPKKHCFREHSPAVCCAVGNIFMR